MTNTDIELSNRLLDGQSLYTVMMPDPVIPSNNPVHLEGFHLQHIILNNGFFWGISGGDTFLENMDKLSLGHFGYTNIDRIFFSLVSGADVISLMDTRRYKEHNWNLKDDCELIWHWKGEHPNQKVKSAIQQSSKLKVALLDSEDVWNIHPVDISYYRVEDDSFSLRTTFITYPLMLRYPDNIRQLLEQSSLAQKMNDTSHEDFSRGLCYPLSCEHFISSMLIDGDGTFQSVYDQKRQNTNQRYKDLKIFAYKRTTDSASFSLPSFTRK